MPSDTKTSKFLSLILRHKPESIGLQLDPSGWVDISELIEKARKAGIHLNQGRIAAIVATSDKQRFALSDDCSRIRANQGHSVVKTTHQMFRMNPLIIYRPYISTFSDYFLAA